MSGREGVRDSLANAETLLSVVTTMKTLSAVHIGKYRKATSALKSSARTLELAWQALARLHPELMPTLSDPGGGALAVVVFGSERGLCGPFNDRVARHLAGMLRERGPAGASAVVFPVGRRVRTRLERLGLETEPGVPLPASLEALDHGVSAVLARIDAWRATGTFDQLYFVYNRPASGTEYRPLTVRLLPVDAAMLRDLLARPWPGGRLPMPIMDAQALLRGLIRQSIAQALVRAFASSMASENIARLMAMEAAERNVEERLASLRVAHRTLRQNAITEELLDIQAAFASMEEPQA